ncbi:MAG: hypothetical protein M3Q14_02050 [bacterium]|nr:hypothetical protein [bacterium]
MSDVSLEASSSMDPIEMTILGGSPSLVGMTAEQIVSLEKRRQANMDCSMEGTSPYEAVTLPMGNLAVNQFAPEEQTE